MPHLFSQWLNLQRTGVRKHQVHILSETPNSRATIKARLLEIMRVHYVSRETTQQRLSELGAPLQTAQMLREHLPKRASARSGDVGEIFAAEAVEDYLGYNVPIRRRFKESRKIALRGDDVIGVKQDTNPPVWFGGLPEWLPKTAFAGEEKPVHRAGLAAAPIVPR